MPAIKEELQQNNPILYIIIGAVKKEIYDGIRNRQEERIGLAGIAYVHIDEHCSDEDIIEQIKKAHESFMIRQYLYAGEIRVNYVFDIHDPFSLSLLRIKERAEWVLSYLYPVGVLTDIFALIDDKRTVLSSYHHKVSLVFHMLESISDDNCMVYLLSNVSSKSVYNDDEVYSITNSIALIALVKDYVSLNPSVNIQSRYNEEYFKKDSLKNIGRFMSIGYANIKKPVEVIKKILLTKLLTFMEKPDFDMEIRLPHKNIVKTSSIIRALEKDNLKSIAVNAKQNIKNTTKLQAIELIFNHRLDIYFSLNFSTDMSFEKEEQELLLFLHEILNDANSGFFAVYSITSRNGQILDMLNEALDENKLAIDKLKYTYSQWCGEKTRINSNEWYCYELAQQYLELRWEQDKLGKMDAYLEHLKKFIINYHLELKNMKKEVDSLVVENNRVIVTLESALPFMNYSVRSFYEALLIEYLDANFEEYAKLYCHMYNYLKQGEFKKYRVLLNDYIESTLLRSEIFNKPITDETADILRFNQISDDSVYSYIFNWIISNKQYNIFLKTGEKHLHSEINILLDVNSELISDSRKEFIGKEHINFFYENNENEIDIIYHIGGFDKDELYYSELYKGLL